MSNKINKTLRECFKQLNPNLVFQLEEEKHRVKNWPDYLSNKELRYDASIKTDIYNEGGLEIHAYHNEKTKNVYDKGGRIDLYFHQTPLRGQRRRTGLGE